MDADLPIDAEPAPRRGPTIRSMMLGVVVFGCLFAWGLGMFRVSRRLDQEAIRPYELVARIKQDDPSVGLIQITGSYNLRPLGCTGESLCRLGTKTGREVRITVGVRQQIFGGVSGVVTFESGGRSVAWPLEDLERGRKIELRAIFPEAF
jgi:hypothetical protein